MARPRVWLIPHLKGWSYDSTARALERYLADRFEIRIAYQKQLREVRAWRADLHVDFWWRRNLRLVGLPMLKQVSSHRWQQVRHGRLSPKVLIKAHIVHTLGAVVPSRRLHAILTEPGLPLVRVDVCPKGFHPELLSDHGMRRGPIEVGWAGSAQSVDKNVDMLQKVEPRLRLADWCLTQGEMGDFYNAIDIIAIASDAEGDPRPLIEGMACGCFPVTTDVGIVPELVQHGRNGLVVERSSRAFAEAFAWCRENPELVRAAGRENARAMLATRTWASVAPAWGDAFDAAIARAKLPPYCDRVDDQGINAPRRSSTGFGRLKSGP